MEALRSLPSDLVELYKHIVEKLGENDEKIKDRGRKMLVWAAFAERPMIIEEFGDAIIIPSDNRLFTPRNDFISEARISPFEPLIANCCGGLLEIRSGRIVQLLHQTTRDFILDKSLAAPFDTDELRGDTEITVVCLRYLGLILQSRAGLEDNGMQDIQSFVEDLSNRPLLNYILTSLPKHLDHLNKNCIPDIVNKELSIIIESLKQSPQSNVYDLLERWCEKDLSRPIGLKINLEFANESRDAMLVTAAREGYFSVVASLLAAHAEINGFWGGFYPVGAAASKGHEAIVRLLLKEGADLESSNSEYGQKPLSLAAENGHEAVVRLLLEKGADLESRDTNGRAPLSWAAESGHETVVQLLLHKGANLESQDMNGQTPLLLAAESGHEAVVQLLLEKGADLESQDRILGRTPLSLAAESGHEAVVQLLLEKGADLGSRDTSGRAPLSMAAESGHEAVVQLLLDKGANLESQDMNGRTPLSLATRNGHNAVVQLLLEREGSVADKAV